MPKLNGIELLVMIKKDKRLDKIPVYILTTSCSQGDIDKIDSLGAKLLQKQSQFLTNVSMLSSIIQHKEGIGLN
jgi:CheY-like chemotaxis protein